MFITPNSTLLASSIMYEGEKTGWVSIYPKDYTRKRLNFFLLESIMPWKRVLKEKSLSLFFMTSRFPRCWSFTWTEAAVWGAAAQLLPCSMERVWSLQVLHLHSYFKPFTDTENKAVPSLKSQRKGYYVSPASSVSAELQNSLLQWAAAKSTFNGFKLCRRGKKT